jgi:chemotaxis protein methyltransferase CheR
VGRRIRDLGLRGFSEYLDRLAVDPSEAAVLPDLIRVTVSRFFRERSLWESLAERVLPEILERTGSRAVHAWSAGCCGGEEPYMLAVLWEDRVRPRYPEVAIQIVATDIDGSCLERARRAVYKKASLREAPPEVVERWFLREANRYRLRSEAIRLVDFRVSNLRTDPPPERMDLVLCRYLAFTHYKGKRRCAVAQKLWNALRPGGVLMIGRKEDLGSEEAAKFAPLPELPGFYRRLR